jgi:hypothetical protein
MAIRITTDEWMKELEAALSSVRKDDPGRTSGEWAEHLGKCAGVTRGLIKEGLRRGMFRRGRRMMEDIGGRMIPVNVYQFVKSAKKKR